jgi:diguanylate cyclase (GGDEF)-like protein
MAAAEAAVDKLRALQELYTAQLPEKLAALRRSLAASSSERGLAELHRGAHGLAGSGGTFGYPHVSAIARSLERLAAAALRTGRGLSEAEREAVAALLDALERAAWDGAPAPAPAPPDTPARAVAEHPRKLVYLLDGDANAAAALKSQLVHFGYQAEVFATQARLAAAPERPALGAIIMSVDLRVEDLASPSAHTKFLAASRLKAPVIFLGARGDLPARLVATRAGCAGYFVKPTDVRALVGALDALTGRRNAEPERVLIVDDSPELAERYAVALESAGLRTFTTGDPLRILSCLAEFRPDLVLMDMVLPGCTGAELAAVIRQFEAYVSVPIVFLSTELDPARQLAAIALGGDEFLTKPIAPDDLVAAVSARLRRYRALRACVTQDGLTGLLNHAASKERIAVEISRALRERHPLSLAMIDLDHFKSINDTHGHPAGDRVLRSLAELLRQRLRKSDVIGRLGGEEFVVALPDACVADAARLMDRLREAFAGVRHACEGGEFHATFSCGVAELRARESAEELCVLADGALYRAKQGGRNCVLVANASAADHAAAQKRATRA